MNTLGVEWKSSTQQAMHAAGLSTREREILELRFWHGMDRAETRKALSLSKTRISELELRALRKMRKITENPTKPHNGIKEQRK